MDRALRFLGSLTERMHLLSRRAVRIVNTLAPS
jgi:hypothetical protein